MSKSDVKSYTDFVLPAAIITKVEVIHLVREFELLDDAYTSRKIRDKAGSPEQDLPVTSSQLQAFLEANPVDLENNKDREAYLTQLKLFKNNLHVLNMTFAVPADPESLQQLSAYVRESINPQTVIEAHLQPALVAGVYLRSQNHVFDFSVRNALNESRGALKKELGALRG